jgi:hypothetical protein
LSDARRFASVLPDRDFVQMPGVAQNKFKLSVARGLHLTGEKVPKWNNLTIFGNVLAAQGR